MHATVSVRLIEITCSLQNVESSFKAAFFVRCKAQNPRKEQWAGHTWSSGGFTTCSVSWLLHVHFWNLQVPGYFTAHVHLHCFLLLFLLISLEGSTCCHQGLKAVSPEQHKCGAVGCLGALQSVKTWYILHHTPFNPFLPGSLKEPVRCAGTLWNLNTNRQLKGSGEDISLISKTPSHWASFRCKSTEASEDAKLCLLMAPATPA